MKNEDVSVHIGEKHNYLTIEKFDHFDSCYRLHYICRCKCGNRKIIRYDHLCTNGVQSCGCIRKEGRNKKHGFYGKNERLCKIWDCIKRRCNNPKNPNFKYYGGRGIKICDEWSGNLSNFFEWAVNNGYRDDLTIDRIDVNGNYEPSNCRWIPFREQAQNKRANHYISVDEDKKCLAEWVRQFDKSDTMFYYWKKKGLSDEECIKRMKDG